MARTPEERWAAAERIAESAGAPDRRRRGRRVLLVATAFALLIGAAQPVLRLVLHPAPTPPTAGTTVQPVTLWIGLVVMGLGLLATTAVLVLMFASGPVDLAVARVEAPLTRRQLRHARRAIRGAVPTLPEERVVVVGLARQDRRWSPVLLGLLGALAIVCAGALTAFVDLPIGVVLGLASLAAVVLAALHAIVRDRAAARFLRDDTPSTTP